MKKAAWLCIWVGVATLLLGHLSYIRSDADATPPLDPQASGRAAAPRPLTSLADASTPTLAVSSLATFQYVIGGPPPATQSLRLTSDDVPVPYALTLPAGSWLDAKPRSGLTPADVTLTANPAGLAAGTYNSIVTVGAQNVLNPSAPVQATLIVTAPTLSLSPASLAFSAQLGDTSPQIRSIVLNSDTPVSFTALASGGGWLSVSPNTGTTPATLKAIVDPSGVATGTYDGSIAISVGGLPAKQVPVKLAVSALPSVSAAPSALDLVFQAPAAPPTASLQVTGSPAGTAFTAAATTSEGGDWLSINPSSGSTPATIAVAVNPGDLPSGVYHGSIAVAGPSAGTGSTVPVTLTVLRPKPAVTVVVNAASFESGAIAPGELISIGGVGLGPSAPASLTLDAAGYALSTLAGVQVIFLPSGVSAPLTYVSGTQINAIVPYELAGSASATMVVRFAGQTSAVFPVTITDSAPSLFTYDGSGSGGAAIVNQDGSVNSPDHPAPKGSTVVLYVTGEGQTQPAGVTGKITTVSSTPPLTPQPVAPVAVTIGGRSVPIAFYGEAPGLISGVLQINVTLPEDIDSGALPIRVSVGNAVSKTGVTIAIQ